MIVLVPWKNEESSNHCIHSCSSFVGIKVLLLKYNEKFQSLPYHQHLIAFLNNRNNWKLLSRHTHKKTCLSKKEHLTLEKNNPSTIQPSFNTIKDCL